MVKSNKLPHGDCLKFVVTTPIFFAETMTTELDIQSVYTMRVASKLTGITPGTIREYERQGLLRTHRDSQNNHRLFTHDAIKWIIQLWKLIHEEGLNYEGIRRLLLTNPCWKVIKCPADKQDNCKVFTENKSTCWSLGISSECCIDNENKCQTCKVYTTAHENPYLLTTSFKDVKED